MEPKGGVRVPTDAGTAVPLVIPTLIGRFDLDLGNDVIVRQSEREENGVAELVRP